MQKLTLTYFGFQARGEPIRLAFLLGDIPFEDDRISMEEFAKNKEKGEYKFGQLPILCVDGKKFAQSRAILKYAGKLAGLYPQTYIEQLAIDEGIDLVEEMFTAIVETVHISDKNQKKQAREKLANETLPRLFTAYNKQLQYSPQGYYGYKLSVADLYLYTVLKWVHSEKLEYLKYDLSQHKALQSLFHQLDIHPKIKKQNEQYQYPAM